jgi:hypothetical protein
MTTGGSPQESGCGARPKNLDLSGDFEVSRRIREG